MIRTPMSCFAIAAALSMPLAAAAPVEEPGLSQTRASSAHATAPSTGYPASRQLQRCDNIIACAILAASCASHDGTWTVQSSGIMDRPDEAICAVGD